MTCWEANVSLWLVYFLWPRRTAGIHSADHVKVA
jgi:hypothetical protein